MENHSSQPNILCVNDEPVARRLLEGFFRHLGWRFEIVEDAESAMRVLSSRDFDAVISELSMTVPGSGDFISSVKTANPHLPVIVIVKGTSRVADVLNIISEGAVDILQKPLDISSLEHSVKRVLAAEQRREASSGVYRFVKSESISMQMTTIEACAIKIPLLTVERLYRAGRIDRALRLRLELAFQEAIANCIEHGNLELNSEWKETVGEDGEDRYSLEKKNRLADQTYGNRLLTIEIKFDQKELNLLVRDQGRGFDFEVSNRGGAELQCYGRGMAIIKSSMDKIEFRDSGREIRMTKYI